MRRREFIAFAGSVVVEAWPRNGWAQHPQKLNRIGILGVGSPTDTMLGPEPDGPYTKAFLAGMRERGYVYGRHFVTEPRSAEGTPARFPSLAAELVALQPDVIVAAGPALLLAKGSNFDHSNRNDCDLRSSGRRLCGEPCSPGQEFYGP